MSTLSKQKENALIECVKKNEQDQILFWWSGLNSESRQNLLKQVDQIDFDQIRHFQELLKKDRESMHKTFHMEPPEVIRLPKKEAERKRHENARFAGEKMLREGRIGTFMVAGGQGTRLGFDGPKGSYPISRMSGNSIFKLFADKILAESRYYNVSIPWYIMTSETNDISTRSFFESNDYFGLNPADVMFVRQRMIPGLDADGKLILDAKDHLFENPNGHGGSFIAMAEGGVLEDCRKRGIEHLSYFHVDNVLIQPLDPVFIGFHVLAGSEMSSKMVPKRHADEKVGVFGVVDGRLCVVEYSDMSQQDMNAVTADGRLKYEAGSIGIHIISGQFAARMSDGGLRLPYHVAFKKIPRLAEDGQWITPDKPNGYKFETFVFDAIREAKNAIVLEIERNREFSPVKNQYGPDSPQTARQHMTNYFADWLEGAGYFIPRDIEGNVPGYIEISPHYARNKEEFLEKNPRDLKIDPTLIL